MYPTYATTDDFLDAAHDYSKTVIAQAVSRHVENYGNRSEGGYDKVKRNYDLLMGVDVRTDWTGLAASGRKVDAIKWIRAAFGCPLITSKDIVDMYLENMEKLFGYQKTVNEPPTPINTLTFGRNGRYAVVSKDQKGAITLTIDPDMDITDGQILNMLNMVHR
jgi:hypothetical protein